MTRHAELRQLATRLASAVVEADLPAQADGLRVLADLDVRSWLSLDHVARTFGHDGRAPVTQRSGWPADVLDQEDVFVADVSLDEPGQSMRAEPSAAP